MTTKPPSIRDIKAAVLLAYTGAYCHTVRYKHATDVVIGYGRNLGLPADAHGRIDRYGWGFWRLARRDATGAWTCSNGTPLNFVEPETLTLTAIDNDGHGNPRFVAHFLALNTRAELDGEPNPTSQTLYEMALKRAKACHGKRFNNRQFGGGIVFVAYNTSVLAVAISRVTGRRYNQTIIAR
jgi:hypothetical protein